MRLLPTGDKSVISNKSGFGASLSNWCLFCACLVKENLINNNGGKTKAHLFTGGPILDKAYIEIIPWNKIYFYLKIARLGYFWYLAQQNNGKNR